MSDRVPRRDPTPDARQKADRAEQASGQEKADKVEANASSNAEEAERNSGSVSE